MILLLGSCLASLYASAAIELPAVISNNMVLPQQTKVRLWGWGAPSEKVKVTTSWSQQVDSAVTDSEGKWQVFVQTPKAGGPHTITFAAGNTITVDNVLSGAVWLCSGQSNMEWSYREKVDDMAPELARHTQQDIRFFHVPRKTALHPQEDLRARWVVCDSNTLKTFSAVGYFFGTRLRDSLQMPVGLINASWGGTPAEVWTPAPVVLQNETWKKEAERLNKAPWWTITPGHAYNAMIAPLTPFVIDGVIWYQGESNVGAAKSYSGLFGTMIGVWRKAWNMELPVYFVQIAPFKYGNNYNSALLREQQAKVAATVQNTGMVVVSDLVRDTADIHPTNKRDVGHRLAALALAGTYGRSNASAGSKVYEGMSRNGSRVQIRFAGNDGRLVLKGKEPLTLLIAGSDQVFYPAQARVSGNVLEVWHPKVKEPVAVRYQFSSTGIGNLSDSYGLPVAPFRTDDWSL